MAVDVDEQRLSRVYDNLKRLGLRRVKQVTDVSLLNGVVIHYPTVSCWMHLVQRTGVIRRHPDIKRLRRDRDINELAQLQAEISMQFGHILNLGDTGVCNSFSSSRRNRQQIAVSLKRTPTASLHGTGTPERPGLQNLPGAEEG